MSKLKQYDFKQLDSLRNQMDPIADQAVLDLIKFPEVISEINCWEEIPISIPSHFPKSIHIFLAEYTISPTDQEKVILNQGQQFFETYGDLYLAMLGFCSLPYCYAFADGAEVLVRSQRILNDSGRRLGETAKFLLEVFKPGAFILSNQAFLICAKVRLIHAYSRYFIIRYAKDWNNAFGKPINQEDLIGTNLAFSLMVMRGMRKIGKSISIKQNELILGYWRYLGKLMGLHIEFWPNTSKEAFELEKLIRIRHMKNSKAGEVLIRSLLDYYETNQKEEFLKGQSESLVSFLIGKQASEALKIKSKLPLNPEIIGTLFQYLGWKNYSGSKSHSKIARNFESGFIQQFGEPVQILLPERKRS